MPWADLPLPTADNVMPLGDGPIVVVFGGRVLLDGDSVGSAIEIARSKKLQRIDGLFERLKARRIEWISAHAGSPFPGEVNFAVDLETSAAVVKSVFQTAAFAGYPHGGFVVRPRTPMPDGSHAGRLPVEAQTLSSINRLPPEVIQRVVRQDFGRIRACYEAGLKRNPNLRGKVTTRFTIGLDGRAEEAKPEPPHARSTPDDAPALWDVEVTACVAHVFSTLVFPAPNGGVVKVVYPIILNPEE